MKKARGLLIGLLIASGAAPGWAANHVTVESKSVAAGATGVQVGVFIENEIPITGLLLALELREITPGTYVTTAFDFEPQAGGRVGHSPLGPAYDNGVDSTWPGANITSLRYAVTGAPPCSGPVSNTYAASAGQVDFVSPDAILHATVSQGTVVNGDKITLAPGSDPAGTANASFLFTFNVNSVVGQFEIDTCCVRPGNHLSFLDENPVAVFPTFTKGVITVAPDVDGDEIPDALDNCPAVYNPGQENGDLDDFGDVCDSLVITVYSPVDLIVTSPSGQDSIAPNGINTMGAYATYDSTTDNGLGPNGIPGEPDDRVLIMQTEPGQYTVTVIPEVGAQIGDDYFLGIRDPGGNVDGFVSMSGLNSPFVSESPVANSVPPPGQSASVVVMGPASQRRGDLNGDATYDVLDVVGAIGIAFRGAMLPIPAAIADVNSDGLASDILDVVRLVGHVFRGQPEPGP